MKYIIGITLAFTFFSCSSQDEMAPDSARTDNAAEPVQKWQLVLMSGNFSGVPPEVGADMDWQEHYLLYADETFTKIREWDGDTTEERGTYAVITLEDGDYLELTYPADNELIGNCSSEPKELLYLKSSDQLIGTWQACDGPGLVYEKVEAEESQK